MRRRDVLILLASLLQPPAALAQQRGRKRVVAIMPSYTTTAGPITLQPRFAFLQRLTELGWEAGRNVDLERHIAANEAQAVTELMSGLARERIDVVLVLSLQMALAVRSVAADVPIVVAAAGDPVGTGAAASLARPGGTITGMALMASELAAKRLERLVEFRPGARRIAILHNPGTGPAAPLMVDSALKAAGLLGVEARLFAASRRAEIDAAFDAIADWNAGGVVVLDDSVLFIERATLLAAADQRKLPLACPFREMGSAGCLFTYSSSMVERFVRAAEYIDKILRGANPADLPFDQPTKFELVINLQTAKALGISVPQTLLATADEVIE